MLARSPELIEGMIEIASQRKWLETTFSAIKFSQCIIQGLWYTNHPLMQIPHLTENEIKLISKNSSDSEKCLWEYIRTSDADKKGLSGLSNEQREDIYKVCQILPHLNVEYGLFVEDEEPEDERTKGMYHIRLLIFVIICHLNLCFLGAQNHLQLLRKKYMNKIL